MINFKDLSLEDQEKLLEQARQIVDEENLRNNALAMYGMKKKELLSSNLNDIYKCFNLKSATEQAAAKTRYVLKIIMPNIVRKKARKP